MKIFPEPPNVVAVQIGWANRYDGKTTVTGTGDPPNSYGEARAFTLDPSDGLFHCGIGMDPVGGHKRNAQMESAGIDYVFIAQETKSTCWKIVGIYQRPSTYRSPYHNKKGTLINWHRAKADKRNAIELLGNQRVDLPYTTRLSTHMRVWVKKEGEIQNGSENAVILKEYRTVLAGVHSI